MEQFIRPKEDRPTAINYDKQFHGKWVIITGATGDIGYAIAKQYAKLGTLQIRSQFGFNWKKQRKT